MNRDERGVSVYLVSTGMVCSVGLSASAACAALRAGISGLEELPYRSKTGEPVVGAAIPSLNLDLPCATRLVEMLVLSLKDCIDKQSKYPWHNVPLLVGLAKHDRPGSGRLRDDLIAHVQQKLGQKFHPQLSSVIATGHTAAFEGLRAARKLLQNPDLPGCLLCGVDSYINGSSIWWLQRDGRLKTDDNSNGVIPGEAAAAVYLQRNPVPKPEALSQVIGLGFATEEATVLSDEPLLGIGLTAAARQALIEANLEMHEIDFRLSDVTGESYGFKEQALGLARLMRVHRDELPIWHVAESIGDCGAAAGVCQLVYARESFLKHYAPGDYAACYTSAVPGARAVAVLRRVRNSET